MKTGYIPLLAAAASLTLAACSKDCGQVADGQELRLGTADILSGTRAADQSLQLTQFADKETVDIFLAESVSEQPQQTMATSPRTPSRSPAPPTAKAASASTARSTGRQAATDFTSTEFILPEPPGRVRHTAPQA